MKILAFEELKMNPDKINDALAADINKDQKQNMNKKKEKDKMKLTGYYLEQPDDGQYDSTNLSALKRGRPKKNRRNSEEFEERSVDNEGSSDDMNDFIDNREDSDQEGEWENPKKKSRISRKMKKDSEVFKISINILLLI
jgi:hypothetical protein